MLPLKGLWAAHVGLAGLNTYLAMKWPMGLFSLTSLLSGVFLWQFQSHHMDYYDALRKAGKVLGVLSFGLGSVAAYATFSKETQTRYLGLVTKYVNFAVIGNVAVMGFVPGGGTIRGMISPVLCATMSSWLVIEASEKHWKTVQYDENGLFLYNASPPAWIGHHALYRASMLTLPCFDTAKYVLLEPLSLGIMMFLSRYYRKPNGMMFGYADTIAVASAAAVFSIFETTEVPKLVSDENLDLIVVPIQVLVLFSALRCISNKLLKR